MVRINSPILSGTPMGLVMPRLTMEQQMLLRTLREKEQPMSVARTCIQVVLSHH